MCPWTLVHGTDYFCPSDPLPSSCASSNLRYCCAWIRQQYKNKIANSITGRILQAGRRRAKWLDLNDSIGQIAAPRPIWAAANVARGIRQQIAVVLIDSTAMLPTPWTDRSARLLRNTAVSIGLCNQSTEWLVPRQADFKLQCCTIATFSSLLFRDYLFFILYFLLLFTVLIYCTQKQSETQKNRARYAINVVSTNTTDALSALLYRWAVQSRFNCNVLFIYCKSLKLTTREQDKYYFLQFIFVSRPVCVA